MPSPLRIAFLGCGFITRVHSRNLKRFKSEIVCGYASRDKAKAAAFCGEYVGTGSYSDYADAIHDPNVDAVVIAVPPKFHLNLTLQALSAGKHVLVEKPAYPTTGDYHAVRDARDRAKRVVLVGENDHYKPLAITLRKLLADGVIGEMVFGHFSSVVKRLKEADDWRNDESMAGGDAFFEEGIHWLHLAASLGPEDHVDQGLSPGAAFEGTLSEGPDQARQEHDGVVHVRQRRGRVAVLLARDPVDAERPAPLEVDGPQRRDHLRIERRGDARSRRGITTNRVPGFQRHARLPGDVSGLPRIDRTESPTADESRAGH